MNDISFVRLGLRIAAVTNVLIGLIALLFHNTDACIWLVELGILFLALSYLKLWLNLFGNIWSFLIYSSRKVIWHTKTKASDSVKSIDFSAFVRKMASEALKLITINNIAAMIFIGSILYLVWICYAVYATGRIPLDGVILFLEVAIVSVLSFFVWTIGITKTLEKLGNFVIWTISSFGKLIHKNLKKGGSAMWGTLFLLTVILFGLFVKKYEYSYNPQDKAMAEWLTLAAIISAFAGILQAFIRRRFKK